MTTTRTLTLLLTGALPLVLACESDSLKPEGALNDSKLYWDLNLNHDVATMSTTVPYNTLQLVATPRNYLGEPLSGLPAPQFRSQDPAVVAITPDGVLQALAPTSGSTIVEVYATITTNNLKHADTVRVQVRDIATPPVLANFSIHPLPPDSAKVAKGLGYSLSARLTDAGGVPITDFQVYARSSNPRRLEISGGTFGLFGKAPFETSTAGVVTLYANTTLYGIHKADTLEYRVGHPVWRYIALGPNLVPGDVWLGIGGSISFIDNELVKTILSFTGQVVSPKVYAPIDVTFETDDLPHIAAPAIAITGGPVDPWLSFNPMNFFGLPMVWGCTFGNGDCGSGNIQLAGSGGAIWSFNIFDWFTWPPHAVRTFTAPGTYEYKTSFGTSGRIIVFDDR